MVQKLHDSSFSTHLCNLPSSSSASYRRSEIAKLLYKIFKILSSAPYLLSKSFLLKEWLAKRF
jgi:hypothetical protein